MNWLTDIVRPKIKKNTPKEIADNLWQRCPVCNQMLFSKELKELQLKLPEYKINLDSLEQRLKSIDIDSLNNEKVIENVEYNAAMSF